MCDNFNHMVQTCKKTFLLFYFNKMLGVKVTKCSRIARKCNLVCAELCYFLKVLGTSMYKCKRMSHCNNERIEEYHTTKN